jgi:hypothetical protein
LIGAVVVGASEEDSGECASGARDVGDGDTGACKGDQAAQAVPTSVDAGGVLRRLYD